MAIFGPKPLVNPFGKKMQFFDFFNFFIFITYKGVFSSQNIVKDILLPYFAEKKEVGKMTSFGPKPWVNSFGKMAIFRLFEIRFFIAPKKSFLVLEYLKRHFPALFYRKKRSWKNDHFWTKIIG